MAFLRNTAYHIRISDINQGEYKKEEALNYVLLNGKQISRISIIGTIVSKEEKTAQIDDGSAIITIREFDTNFLDKFNIGDIVLVIGKIRESIVRYILPEIIKKTDKKWLKARANELGLKKEPKEEHIIQKETVKEQIGIAQEEKVEEVEENSILDYIRKKDKGEGVDIDSIISDTKSNEKEIQELLKTGEIFIIKPGFVKVLE